MLMEHENCPCMETCPLNRAMALIGGKWKMQILCSLYNNGPTRYNQLKKALDGVSNTVLANALRELMADAGEVYIMGHSFADMDAVGAAVGVCCAARKQGKTARIVIDLERNAAGPLLAALQALPEYADVFLPGSEAFLRLRPGALLVVVDTSRPDMVESHQVLESCNRVAVIDHHRRSASYIENAAFSFHEPYASSASELVTELLQYLVEPMDLLR